MTTYQQRIHNAQKAGFEVYVSIQKDNAEGTILFNTDVSSPYNGECIDIYEDGSYEQYCQFKGQQPAYVVE